jgi:hypothetical protein
MAIVRKDEKGTTVFYHPFDLLYKNSFKIIFSGKIGEIRYEKKEGKNESNF